MELIKNSNEGFKNENYAKVAYMLGIMDDKLPINTDWDELMILIENIVIWWENFEDIRDVEEEGYIMAYARRKIKEYIEEEDGGKK